MNVELIYAGLKLAFTDGPIIQKAIDKALADPVIRDGLGAVVDVANGLKSAVNSEQLEQVLVAHGVDPTKVTQAIQEATGGADPAGNSTPQV